MGRMLLGAMVDRTYTFVLFNRTKSNLNDDDGFQYDNENPVASPRVQEIFVPNPSNKTKHKSLQIKVYSNKRIIATYFANLSVFYFGNLKRYI